MRQNVSTGSRFEEAYGYSRAVRVGDTVYVAGTVGIDRASGRVPEDPAEQYDNAIDIITGALAEAGAGLADVVQLTVYVASAELFTEVVGPRLAATFGGIRPTNAALVVAFPWPEIKLEIQSVAVIGAGG
ncbi:Rid family hydrolase [Acuticoccus sp.]|uniref:Rid family hydrolase n=1 Tax=Acuticoccus sp. TaxID=1904378 RepID=UPI003B5204A2